MVIHFIRSLDFKKTCKLERVDAGIAGREFVIFELGGEYFRFINHNEVINQRFSNLTKSEQLQFEVEFYDTLMHSEHSFFDFLTKHEDVLFYKVILGTIRNRRGNERK